MCGDRESRFNQLPTRETEGASQRMIADTTRAKTSDAEAGFETLYESCFRPTFGLVHRVVGESEAAEDILQEGFSRLAQSTLRNAPTPQAGAWLRRVCLNLAFNAIRARRRAAAREEAAYSDGHQSTGADPVHAAVQRETRAEVQRVLAALPQRQRDCLLLRYSGFSYAEIAATLEIALGSVGVLLARAEGAFRRAYEAEALESTDVHS
ncbi:MAG: sigma-70 family RNA polymerase sigma factor [Chloroflexota bacterium]